MTDVKPGKNYTTHEVAGVLGVCPRTAAKLFDGGDLKGWRLPGRTGERRIFRDSLVSFMRAHGLPLGGFAESPAVLLVGLDDLLAGRLAESLSDCAVARAADPLELGMALRPPPAVVVIDALMAGRRVALALAESLRAKGVESRLAGVATEDEPAEEAWRAAGYSEVLRRPASPDAAAAAIRKMLNF